MTDQISQMYLENCIYEESIRKRRDREKTSEELSLERSKSNNSNRMQENGSFPKNKYCKHNTRGHLF